MANHSYRRAAEAHIATLQDILPNAEIDWSVLPTRPGSKRPAVKCVRRWRETAPTRRDLVAMVRQRRPRRRRAAGRSLREPLRAGFRRKRCLSHLAGGIPCPRAKVSHKPHSTRMASVLPHGPRRFRFARKPGYIPPLSSRVNDSGPHANVHEHEQSPHYMGRSLAIA
jgi:hypothetical protein